MIGTRGNRVGKIETVILLQASWVTWRNTSSSAFGFIFLTQSAPENYHSLIPRVLRHASISIWFSPALCGTALIRQNQSPSEQWGEMARAVLMGKHKHDQTGEHLRDGRSSSLRVCLLPQRWAGMEDKGKTQLTNEKYKQGNVPYFLIRKNIQSHVFIHH